MGKPIRSRFVVFAAVLFTCGLALAQQPEVLYSDEFQSYGSPKNPPGWVDTAIGASTPVAAGLFKTWPDPTQGNKAANIVFGSKSSSGKPEGDHPRMGHFSTLTTKTFSASGRFEYRGRFIRTNADSRIGFTFLSSYPELDKYYLIGLWSVPGSSNLTMQLFGFGAGTVTGTTDSNFTPATNTWYRFLINVDDVDGATKVRARFWADGATEPSEYSIDATDAGATRLTSGRIGIWAAVKGANYVDDLFAKSPVDHTAPVITFSEGSIVLPPDAITPIGHDARVDVHATDDLSGVASLTATRNGEPYVPLTPIATEGRHTIAAVAVDNVGNTSTAQTTVLVDKTPPVITLTAGGSPLALPVAYFKSATAIDISASDVWTGATVTATLDGQPYASGTPIAAPGAHYLTVQAVDGVNNAAEPVQAKIVIDTGAPVIEFFEKGVALASPAKFNFDPAIEIRVGDASPADFAATLDGAVWTSLDPVPPGWHDITVVASDAAGNESTATLRVLVDKERPVVVLTAGGVVLDPAQTAKYKDRVAIGVDITDATLVETKTAILLDGQPYAPLTDISTEGNPHTLTVHAEDEAGNKTDVTLAVVVDSTPPVIVFSSNGAELDPRELQKFRADAVIAITVTDAFSSTPTYDATLVTGTTSAPFASATPILVEARHELRVVARDDVGNTAETTLRILVDKTPPVIAFSALDQPLDTSNETPFKEPVAIAVSITDALTAEPSRTIRLNGADYVPGTTISVDGHHVVTVHAEDEAGNSADAEVRVLVDQTPPAIAFLANGAQLDPSKRNDFNAPTPIEIRVEDALSSSSYEATLDGAPYASGTPLAEGHHTLVVRATDALENAAEATLGVLVDATPPVVVLKNAETGAPLPATGAIFGKPLTVQIDVQDTSLEIDIVKLLDGAPFDPLTIADYGQHTLTVTVTDELGWSTTVTTEFIVDDRPPVLTVTEGTTPLVDGASFTRDINVNVGADDITPVTITAAIDGVAYTPGTLYRTDGTHVLVVNAVDAAGNHAPAITRTFHIDRNAPEVVLRANGTPLQPDTPFAADVTFTVDVVSATETTRVATIDGAPYTLGTLFTAEGHHHIKVVVTNMAALSTTVDADFTIDKTPPTLSLFASEGTPFTDAMQFAADLTPFTVADDNLAKPPDVVVLLDGQTLAPNTAVTEESEHTISATAIDKAGNSTSVGPFAFVLDKTPPEVTVEVDGEPLVDGALFNKAITPAIEAEDLTESTFDITLDGAAYTRGTLIEPDGEHTLVVRVTDALQNERALDPLRFTIDKTAPVVRIIDKETNAVFTGGQFKRPLDLKVEIVDQTATITTATLVDRTPEPDAESPWTSEQQVSSDGHYTLQVTVTDEAGWVTVVPPVEFTIDQAAPVITVTESGSPLVARTIFNRDATPKIDVQDTTATTVDATLDGAAFVSETPVTQEAWHTLTVKATDALGFVTELLPIEFAVDKTPPVVSVTENGVPFADGVNLDHDAAPHVAASDVTAYTIDARVDGQPFALGSLVTAEGPHTFDVTVTDAANWKTTVPTIHFVVDKTAPVVTVSETETGGPLQSGDEFGVTIAPFVRVTDITATTVVALLNGNPYTPDTPIEADGEYILEVTVTDAVGRATVVPPIAFIIDKTAPVVRVLERGQPFAATKLDRGAELDIDIEDLTATTTDAKIGSAPFTFPGTFSEDGHHTLTVTVTDHLGHATVVPPVAFTIDQTPPVVNITLDGQPLESGLAFNRPSVRPEIHIQDTTATTVAATLNGAPYTFGADIAAEGRYTLDVEVTDELGWKTTVPAIVFFIDRTAPVVRLMEGENELTDGLWFNRDVAPRVIVTDTTSYEATATLTKDGGAAQTYVLETAIAEEGNYTLSVSVTDKVGLKTDVPPVTFTIDKTSPAITVLYPAANAELTTPQVVVVGDSDDAITVTVNETIDTTIDATEKRYSSDLPIDLLEGENALTIVGVDRAGNSTTITQIVRLDTRAPELAITAPAANACLTTPAIEVSGTVGDPNVAGIRLNVTPGTAAPIDATLSADRRTWTASITFPAEGKFVVSATARDNGGHESVASVQVSIDSTKPRIEITDGGVPFIAPFVNRPIAPLVRVIDADPKATLTVTLDGAPYASGTPIAAEKDYELKASATDCAGNVADEVIVRFTIDRTPPQFLGLAPANGAVVGLNPGEITQVSGTVSPDTVSVVVEATGAAATVNNGTFAFASLPIAEGRNAFSFVAVDRAGNATRLDYSFRVKSSAPTVEIVENGSLIVSGTRYTRPVTVDIRSNESDATITATHNGQPFTSGTTIAQDGSHTISATARDAFDHTSSAEVTFTIDSDGPVVTIAEPQDGTSVTADRIRVRGTITGDPVSAFINGSNLTLTSGAFDAEVALELGPNAITVVAFDAAGNAGQATVDVTRGSGALGLILHTPTNNTLTNRRTTTVAGQVLTPAGVTHVTVNGIEIPIDAAGAFRKTDFALAEGVNTITATVNKGQAAGSVSVTVTADFTPPAVTIRESGKLLEEEERFATQAVLTVEASDGGQPLAPQILLDASPATAPMTVTASGGHTIVATAQDAAGNEKRVERTFFIGTAGAGGCALSDFDPADGSVVTTNTVTLVGRSGGAAGVNVDGTAAVVSNGTFSAIVNLSADGAKTITIQCTDAAGNDTGTPKTITLTRVTGAPSIDITAPADRSVTESEAVTVNGTIAGDVAKVVVNGVEAGRTATTFTATNVRLAPGLNTITARAYNPAGVVSADAVRITRLTDLPRISITSPTAVFMTAAESIDVSGTWTNLDPASITVTGGASASAVQTTTLSDSTGTFVAPLVALAAGPQTITVRGTDRLGRAVTATAEITRADGLPTIAVTQPADNTYFGAGAGAKVTVAGELAAQSGATVEVNGVAATIDANASTFTAQVDFSTIPGGLTPVIARVTEPDGDSAVDAIRVTKLADALSVTQVFPEDGASNVDPGTLPLVLFSAPMDRASVRNAFRLKNASGAIMNGDVTLERDVLVFAPAVLLTAGETYTIRIAAGAQDLGGNALAADFTSTFTVASSAPATAPSLGAYPSRVCESIDLTGTAPAGSQVRFELGTLKFNTTASASGAFSYRVPLSGRSGFQVVRVRIVGSDGSLSPAVEAHFEVDCAGPQVVNASVDRTANVVTITFSKAIDLATVTVGETGSVRLQLADGAFAGGTATSSTPAVVSIAPAQSLATAAFTLTVTTAVEDTNGVALTSPYSRTFSLGDELPDDGSGYIAGEVFDAETGRPLPGASISIDVPTAAFARGVATDNVATTAIDNVATTAIDNVATTAIGDVASTAIGDVASTAIGDVASTAIGDVASTSTVTAVTDNRGRYVRALPEGAHTIRASADGYTTVWRQIIVRAGQGVIPTDIRLTPRGPKTSGTGAALVLTHGGTGAKPLSSAVELRIPVGVVASNGEVTVTSLGAQSLPGLLPLGWSPIASAEIVSNTAPLSGAELTFDVPQQALVTESRTLTAARYHEDRDEWRVLVTAVNVSTDGKATINVTAPGAYALVYPDKSPLQAPPPPMMSAVLTGVADPCAASECPPLVAKNALELTPPAVLPTQRTVGTLSIEGSGEAKFPSGTAVQAYVDEELHLADGTRDVVAPFVTDLLLYRNLAGDTGVAEFHLAPSARASEVVLEVGYDHIRIVPYPERVDRGALIGPEGGRVPADDLVSVEIPAAATTEALKATATSIRDFTSFGTIAGYRIIGGLSLSLQWASAPAGEEVNPVELLKPARATFTVNDPTLPSQLILVEVLEGTPYGRVYRLASQITALEGGTRFSTKPIDRAVLPVDGIIREGTYLLLAPDAPIAFAHGLVRLGAAGPIAANARVTAPNLGVVDVARVTGIFALPVPATPAAPFTLVPRTSSLGDGVPYQHSNAPAPDAVINVGELAITAQPPQVVSTSPSDNATDVGVSAFVQVTFSRDIDPASASIVVSDARGTVSVAGPIVTWKLAAGVLFEPNKRYTVTVGPSTRALNGAALGRSHVFNFTTVGSVTSGEVHPEKIRITIPDAAGNSKILGDAGALPAGWLAAPVRRGVDFSSRPTATAAANGSFAMTVGGVTLSDAIDLRIINAAGSVAAILPLTPFVTEDGLGFIAAVSKSDVRFTTTESITIIVPAGAFDAPTMIRLVKTDKQPFAGVPRFEEELRFAGAVRLEFEGVAKKRLQLEMPVPAGWTPSDKEVMLGQLGQSSRGPRVMIVDTVRIAGGTFTTTDEPSSGFRATPRTNVVLTGREVKKFLLGVLRSGIYIYLDLRVGLASGWAMFDVFQQQYELFWDTWASLYASELYLFEGRGRVAIPVLVSTPFTVEGVDAATGMKVFEKHYASADDGIIESPVPDITPPYPVFAIPTRIDQVDVFEDETLARNFKLTLTSTAVSITSNPAEPLPEGVKIQALNARTGEATPSVAVPPGGAFTLGTLTVLRGDRIVLIAGVRDEATDAALSVVFNEPIDTSALENDIQLDAYTSTGKIELTKHLFYDVDSNGRRIHLDLPSDQLIRGARYEITLKKTIKDLAGNPLKRDLVLSFHTRPVEGPIGSFDIPNGGIRDLARYGNIVFVSALEGGLLAYNGGDPAGMTSTPLSFVPAAGGDVVGYDQHWAVATDHHGRVYSTGIMGSYGVIRGYRVEDFLAPTCAQFPAAPAGANCKFYGAAITGWRPGVSAGLPLPLASTTILSDRVEATPRKLQVLVQDDVQTFDNLAALKAAYPHSVVGTWPAGALIPDFEKLDVEVFYSPNPSVPHYHRQRVTIENVSRDLRWSADLVADDASGVVKNVIAHRDDKIKIHRNLHTYGIISQFGHGVGMFDLNAIESNDLGPSSNKMREQIIATRGDYESSCTPLTPAGPGISDLAFSPETAVVPSEDSSQIVAFAPEVRRGVLGLGVDVEQALADAGKTAECVYRDDGFVPYDRASGAIHPRLQAVLDAFTAKGRALNPRYLSVSAYRGDLFGEPTDYLLVAGGDLGMLMLQVGPPATPFLSDPNVLAGVVWVPNGVVAVRHIPRTHMATLVDTTGRVLLVDLTRVDERYDSTGELTTGLFATTAIAVTAPLAPSGQIGVDDPRIIWKSDPGLVKNTLAPLVDPDTGVIIAGDVTERGMRAVPAIDPRIRMLIHAGGGAMKEVSGATPLGYAPRADLIDSSDPNASAGAFRFQVTLPAGAAKALDAVGRALQMAVESEFVPGYDVAQAPVSLPKAHLRETLRTPPPANADARPTKFVLHRDIPADLEAEIWYQKGASRYTSDWIVAVADPRASQKWKWPAGADKKAAGCESCERPDHLRGKTEVDGVYELWTAGRFITVRPDWSIANNILIGTPYEYLGKSGRLEARFGTIQARKVRPTEVLVPAHNPPVADGMIQETHYLHSGEVETAAVDLNAGGRGGVDVVVARTYRSRTIGGTDIGEGWDSSMYRFLIQRPSGDVEYHDGAGEIWVFDFDESTGTYVAPKGLFLKLARSQRGFVLVDQQWRIAEFNEAGQLSSESDEFWEMSAPDEGNRIRYVYDERGRLSRIFDPMNRATELTYWGPDAAIASCPYGGTNPCGYPGRLREANAEWRKRSVAYEYDAYGRLTKVHLPEFKAGAGVPATYDHTGSNRPTIEYAYESASAPAPNEPPASQPYTNFAEFSGNLKSIKDPEQVKLSGAGQSRVSFTYDLSTDPVTRDRNVSQQWASGETASFSATENVDVLGQRRTYTLTLPTEHDRRRHFRSKTLHEVTVLRSAEASLPETDIGVTEDGEVVPALATTFDYDDDGLQTEQTLPSGLKVTNSWIAAAGAPGKVLRSTLEQAPAGAVIETQYVFDTATLATANVSGVGRRDSTIKPFIFRDNQTPSRNHRVVKSSDLNLESNLNYDEHGRVDGAASTDPGGAGGMQAQIEYYPDSDSIEAGRPWRVKRGGGVVAFETKYSLNGSGEETETTTDLIRGAVTKIVKDIEGRVVSRTITGTGGTTGVVVTEERFGYNADGRVAYHARKQAGSLGGDVVTTSRYDSLGRVIGTSTYGSRVLLDPSVAGADDFTTLDTRTVYDLGSRQITDFDAHRPGEESDAPRTTRNLDRLGRVLETRRTGTVAGTGSIFIASLYDIHGQLAYTTDRVRTATITQHDHFGRPVATMLADGTRAHVTFNEWDEVVETVGFQKRAAPTDPLVETSRTRNVYTNNGRLQLSLDKIESAGRARATAFTWEAGDTITTNRVGEASFTDSGLGATTAVRVAQTTRDSAGRVVSEIVGEATGALDLVAAANVFSEMRVTDYFGDLARKSEFREPRAARKTEVETDYDGLGRPIETREGGAAYVTRMAYDEAGNMLALQTPGLPFAFMSYDARGLMWKQQLPSGDVVRRAYDERGTLRQYIDEEGRVTFYDTDGLGRVFRIRYPDGTSEESRFEDATGELQASRDRAGQWIWFEYDAANNGRLIAEHLGGADSEPVLTADPFTVYDYDDAGRVKRIRNAEAAVELDEFDLLGRPRVTRTIRYKKTGCIPSAVPCGSGLTASPQIAEVYTQGHEWSVHDDERERWRMPVVGSALPADAEEVDTPWRNWIEEQRDGGANVVRQGESVSRSAAAVKFLEASARGMGRLAERKRTSVATELLTRYGYTDVADSGTSAVVPVTPVAPGPPTGGLGRHEVLAATTRIAGTEVTLGVNQRVERIEDYGLVERESKFDYDNRGRLTNTILLRRDADTTNQPVANSVVQPAGFVEAREIAPPRISAGEFALLGAMAKAVVPVTWTAEAPTAGGQITHRTFNNGSASAGEQTFTWSGGRRTGDGSWTTTYDARGRLTSAETGDRRIEYDYDPQDRLVGRIALQKDPGGAWTLETRTNVLARDGLPASATFIWDPIVDRLVAVYDSEVVSAAATPAIETGLVRQYIHGDQAYDDPVEVLIASVPGATPQRYLPIIDEAGTGSLQAVADGTGNLIERVLYADAYGDAPRYLQGAVVERIEHEVVSSMHHLTVAFSETIEAASLADGVRVTARTTDGSLLRALAVTPTLIEANRALRFEVSDTDWTTFAAGAAKIEIAVTPTLRFLGWGAAPLQPAAEWESLLGRAAASAELPFIKTLAPSEFAGSGVLYDLPDLYLAARPESRAKVLFDFHALPLRDPATSFTYVRARWYDASTASFLTPDPMGYEDASNLYAYAGNDPINAIDPTGELSISDIGKGYWGYTKGVAKGAWGLFTGVMDGLIGVAQVSYYSTGALLYATTGGEQYREQSETFHQAYDSFKKVISNPKIIKTAATNAINGVVDTLKSGDAEAIGELGGRVAFEVAATILTGGGKHAAKGAQVVRALETIDDVADTARTLRTVEKLDDLADMSAVARRASPIMKHADDLGDAKWMRPCPVASSCFAAGTLVQTPNGPRPIESIAVGDYVVATGAAGGVPELGEVTAVFRRDADKLFLIDVEEETIAATDEHPFWVDEAGWTAAEDLKPGDALRTADGRLSYVTRVRSEEKRVRVFNFEVRGLHNYFVARAGYLVHNCITVNTIKDALGRTVQASARITPADLGTGTRATAAARRAAQSALGQAGDDASHLVARILGGRGGLRSGNITGLHPALNRGRLSAFEKRLARELRKGNNIDVIINLGYKGGSNRVSHLVYEVSVNGRKWRPRTFVNP